MCPGVSTGMSVKSLGLADVTGRPAAVRGRRASRAGRGQRKEEGKEKQLLIYEVEGPTTAPAVFLGSTRQPPRDPAALASCTSTRRHVAPEPDAPRAAAHASVSPPLPGSGATGRGADRAAPAASLRASERRLAHLTQCLLTAAQWFVLTETRRRLLSHPSPTLRKKSNCYRNQHSKKL